METLIFRARRSLARELERTEERSGRLRKSVNVGSVLAWLKSLAIGGSAAVKVATVVAAGAVVVAAGSQHSRPKPPPVVKAAARPVVPLAIAATHLRPPRIAMVVRARHVVARSAAPSAKKRPVVTKAAPDRRACTQRVPTEREAAVAPETEQAPTPAPAAETPAKAVDAAQKATPAPKHANPAEAPVPSASKPAPIAAKPKATPSHRQPNQPGTAPQANANAPDNPSADAPGRAKTKPKEG